MNPFPLGTPPWYYAQCSFPTRRNGIFNPGDEIEIGLSQLLATGYTVLDIDGNEVGAGSLTPVPSVLQQSNELALATVSWLSASTAQDVGPTFDPGGIGTNHFGIAPVDFIGMSFMVSANALPLSSATSPITFSTTIAGAFAWSALITTILSAPGHNAAVVQTALGLPAQADLPVSTATVAPTSTDSLLVVHISCQGENNVTSVVDSAGNAWVKQPTGVHGGGLESEVWTTTAAHPASITSVTVTCGGTTDAYTPNGFSNFAFYEVFGAQNTAPIDISNTQQGFGSTFAAVQSIVTNPGSVTIARPSKYGCFRVLFTGPIHDDVYGYSYGATTIVVESPSTHFPTMNVSDPAPVDNQGNPLDWVLRGAQGLGIARIVVVDPRASLTDALANVAAAKTYVTQNGHTDPDRPTLELLVSTTSQTSDRCNVFGSLDIFCKDGTIDGSKVFVASGPGTHTGNMFTVYYPDASTQVEVFDDCTGATTTSKINGVSNYIWINQGFDGTESHTMAATAIGNAYKNGVINMVSTLSAQGVTHFEGPSNEPYFAQYLEIVHQMMLFQSYVHQGNVAAKAIGPCSVNIGAADMALFLGAGGGTYCDGITSHDYGPGTDIQSTRSAIEAWLAVLATYGQDAKEIWQTEAGWPLIPVFGVHHPRRSCNLITHALIWEQQGVPREKNPVWYDVSHGFWSVPNWCVNADGSVQAPVPLWRTMVDETYRMNHAEALSFGHIGDRIFFGSIYRANSGAGTAVLWTACGVTDMTITFTVTGTAAPLVYADPFGNTSTIAQHGGRVTVPVNAFAIYLRLPAGVSISVYTCNDWPPIGINGQGTNLALTGTGYFAGGLNAEVNNDHWESRSGDLARSTLSPPDTVAVLWSKLKRADRVIVWCGPCFQLFSGLLDFDVQTTLDGGATWTTQKTVTRTISSFVHGTDISNVGCQRETYCPDEWIFDVPFATPAWCNGVRIYARATTYGGEADLASITDVFGQGDQQHLSIQELAVFCDANVEPIYVVADA